MARKADISNATTYSKSSDKEKELNSLKSNKATSSSSSKSTKKSSLKTVKIDFTKNISTNYENDSQRDNKITYVGSDGSTRYLWTDTCNCTSMINALRYYGFGNSKFPTGDYSRPEDNLAYFILHDSEILNMYKKEQKKKYNEWISNKKGCYNPFEWHKYLAYGTNKWLGSEEVTFRESISISEIINTLIAGKPIVISGEFKYTKSNLKDTGHYNHIVTLVGFQSDEKNQIVNFIVDDPWGKTGHYYDDGKTNGIYTTASAGNDVIISYNDFIEQVKPKGKTKKMGHIFGSAVSYKEDSIKGYSE